MRRVVSLVAFAAVVVVLATPVVARTISEVIPLGGSHEGSVAADRSSCVGVLIPEGARNVSVSVKLDRKSGLDPEFSMYAPDGSEIDAADLAANGGRLRVTAKKITVKHLPVLEGGLYKFVLAGKGGTAGGFLLKCRGKPAKTPKIEDAIDAPGAPKDHRISVPDGAYLTVRLTPAKKSDLLPTLTILTADGVELATESFRMVKGAKISLRKAPLPFFGGYVLRVGSAEGTGAYKLAVKVKAKKLRADPTRPVADAGGVQVVPPGGTAELTGQGSAGARLMWARVSGTGGTFEGTPEAPRFLAPEDGGTHAFQLVAERNGVYSHADTAVIEIDQAPVAVAGASLVVIAGAPVTLDGSESFDLDSDTPLAYSWQQVSGEAVTIADAATARPSFTAPSAAGVLVFALTVNDGFGDSIADRVVVGVGRDVADAGRPVVVTPDDSVYLSGLRTPRNPDTFAWTRIDGNAATIALAGADGPAAAFSAPRTPGTYRFRLVTDGDAAAADEVIVIVTGMGRNGEPRAAAGGISAATSGEAFALSGAASSDPDGDDLRFEWRQADARRVALTGTGATRSGTAPMVASALRFLLMVHDGRKYGPPDQATIVVGTPEAPVSDAGGDASGEPGDTIVLSGTGSAAGPGRVVSVRRWEQLTGLDLYDVANEDAGFEPTAESPTFLVPETGISSLTPDRSILFSLTVWDGEDAESGPDYVVVTFTDLPPNAAPVVTAAPGANRTRPGTPITLSGTATDRDGDPLTWLWTQVSGPVTVTLSGATTPVAGFTAPGTSGTYVFRFAVSDGTATTAANVAVQVNSAPALSAIASPAAAPVGATVTLDGSGTTDPDGDPLTWFWEEIPSAGNPAVPISGHTTAKGSFTVIPYVGTIAQRTRTYRLTVTDVVGPVSATVTFVPNAAPTAGANLPSKAKIRYDGTDASSFTVGGMNDPDGDPLVVNWRVVSGPSAQGATLSAATGPTTTLTVAKPSAQNALTGGLWTVGATVTDGVQGAPERTATVLAYPSWSKDVWAILASSCSTSGCHGNAGTSGGAILFLGPGAPTAYASLVNIASAGSSDPRVSPNDHKKSYLWQLVNSGAMPKSGGKLAPWQINIIRDWIEPEGLGKSGTLSTGAENN